MTGFQPHPGLVVDAAGNDVPALDIARIVEAMGAQVETNDYFDVEGTQQKILGLLEKGGVNVLILKQSCALSPREEGEEVVPAEFRRICLPGRKLRL